MNYWERPALNKRRPPTHQIVKTFVKDVMYHLPPIKGKVLDVGSGNGYFSYWFEKITDTTAIDNSHKMIEMNPVKKKYLMDATELKFKDNTFDIVFESCLLHHTDRIGNVLHEMKRVSKKYVIILEPDPRNVFEWLFMHLIREERQALLFTDKFWHSLLPLLFKSHHIIKVKSVFPNKSPKWLPLKLDTCKLIICEI